MWSKGERSAQTLGFFGIILGVNRKLPLLDEIKVVLSHVLGLARQLAITVGVVSKKVVTA